MAIIARPTKISAGTDYVAGFDILVDEMNDDLNTIYSDYNGNITAANASASAGFLGTQIATKPNGIQTANISAKAVTDVELANDPAVSALRAVGPDHIKPEAIILQHVKLATWDSVPGGSVSTIISGATGLTPLTAIPLMWTIIIAGVPNSAERITVHTHLHSGTNEYYLVIGNPNNVAGGEPSISLVGLTFRLLYIPIS